MSVLRVAALHPTRAYQRSSSQGSTVKTPRKTSLHCSCTLSMVPDSPATQYLINAGVPQSTLAKVLHKCPALSNVDVDTRLHRNFMLLEGAGLDSQDIRSMVERVPVIVGLDADLKVKPVLDFLQEAGLDSQQIRSVIRRFPSLLTYGVKSHLKPHLAYLTSLGIAKAQLPALIVARPYILGAGIEHLVNYLLGCGFPRSKIGSVIRSYPFEYRIPVITIFSSLDTADYEL